MPVSRALPGRLAAAVPAWLSLALLLGSAGCAQSPITSYVPATQGPTSRLLMRGQVEPGESYGVYLLASTHDCSQPQWVGQGTTGRHPEATQIPADRLHTLDVFVTRPNRSYCQARWTFYPTAGRSYLVAAQSDGGACSVSLLDASDPDRIRPEPSARRRDAPGNACVPLAQARSVAELTGMPAAAIDAGRPGRGPSGMDVITIGISEDELKDLISR